MTVDAQDLGELTGPVLLFGGPYSNLQSTLAMREEADRRGIAPENVICTGDVVAYCADAHATVEVIRDWGCHVVLGNCEESLGMGGDDCGCGFDKGSICDLLSVRWYAHAREQITPDQQAWMRTLPHPLTFSLAGFRLAVVHGHERDISEWVFASTPVDEKHTALDSLGVEGIIAGHSGLPFTQVLEDGRLWHNPGVIGVPANDGTSRVWYSILESVGEGIQVTHYALDYDHAGAAARMAEEDLPDAYATALGTGIWPNQDILPSAEHSAMGDALDPAPVNWTPKRRAVA